MQRLISNRKYAYSFMSLIVLCFGYAFSLVLFDDLRMIDSALTYEEAYWWEILLVIFGLVSIFILWISSIQHAWNKGRKTWVVLILFVWPLSLIYTLRFPARSADE
jgi:hypothetical protein